MDSQVFYFIKTTSFFYNEKHIFPAELALAKFSLKLGVFDNIQIRIHPGEFLEELPERDNAQKERDHYHHYPLPGDHGCSGETNYLNILRDIVTFLQPYDSFPILFAEKYSKDYDKNIEKTIKTLEKICYESQEDDMIGNIKVYSIEELFFHLHKTSVLAKNRLNETDNKPFSGIPIAVDQFQRSDIPFSYISKSCDFHNEKDKTKDCCLSKVHRYGYVFSEWCADKNRYELQEGKHCPVGFRT